MHLTHTLGSRSPTLPARTPIPDAHRLQVSAADVAHALVVAGPVMSLPAIIAEHAFTTVQLACVGVRYLCQGDAARKAYQRMTTTEFVRINARQAWANWRTIPRNLHGHLPIDRPLTVV
ncbi:MAG TPA: hypothetical protein VHX44_08510, partial [Planctomycetota bacterium]|nr:hypothetical protein [Planctomycetota bacterium]